MEFRNLKQKFRSNKWYRYGAGAIMVIFLIIVFLLVRSWFAPRVPEIPAQWSEELIGYWAFEEQQGSRVVDTTYNNNHGWLGGGFGEKHHPSQSDGKLGAALQFEGEDYVLVPYNDKFNLKEQVTVEAWVKPEPSAANESLWLPGWKYRRGVVLDNVIEGYVGRERFQEVQVKIKMDTESLIEAGKMQSDCGDLRFTDSDKTTELDWYLERGCNSTTTKFWVKVPSITVRSRKPIYAYYGNFEVDSTSNYQRTMETPPVSSWEWPRQRHLIPEKAFGADITPENKILIGGFKDDMTGEGQLWRAARIRSSGQGEWYRSYHFSSGANHINDVVYHPQGSVLAGFDTGPGDSQWRVKQIKGWEYTENFSSGSDRATAVATDSSGNIVMGGFDYSPGNSQWRVERLNSEGEKLWTYTDNPSLGSDQVNDIAVDSEDNILVAGVDKKKGNDQWRLVKLSPEGEEIFTYLLDLSDGSDVLSSVAVDSEDNIVLGGFDFKQGDFQWKVVKLDSQGNRIWNYENNPSSGLDQLNSVAVDQYDNIVMGGFDYSPGNSQWRVERLNSEGERSWTYTENPTSGSDEINDLAIGKEGNYVLVGFHSVDGPRFLVKKISERKYYDLKPEVTVLQEQIFQEIPSIAVGKLNSYSLRVNQDRASGAINGNLVTTPLDSGWNHLMLVFNGAQQKLYVNSKLKASQSLTSSINLNYNNLLFGFNYAGSIDEVKIYKKALSSKEVQTIYQSSK